MPSLITALMLSLVASAPASAESRPQSPPSSADWRPSVVSRFREALTDPSSSSAELLALRALAMSAPTSRGGGGLAAPGVSAVGGPRVADHLEQLRLVRPGDMTGDGRDDLLLVDDPRIEDYVGVFGHEYPIYSHRLLAIDGHRGALLWRTRIGPYDAYALGRFRSPDLTDIAVVRIDPQAGPFPVHDALREHRIEFWRGGSGESYATIDRTALVLENGAGTNLEIAGTNVGVSATADARRDVLVSVGVMHNRGEYETDELLVATLDSLEVRPVGLADTYTMNATTYSGYAFSRGTASMTASIPPWAVPAEDLSGDGAADVLMRGWTRFVGPSEILRASTSNGRTLWEHEGLGGYSVSTPGDLTGDGLADVVVASGDDLASDRIEVLDGGSGSVAYEIDFLDYTDYRFVTSPDGLDVLAWGYEYEGWDATTVLRSYDGASGGLRWTRRMAPADDAAYDATCVCPADLNADGLEDVLHGTVRYIDEPYSSPTVVDVTAIDGTDGSDLWTTRIDQCCPVPEPIGDTNGNGTVDVASVGNVWSDDQTLLAIDALEGSDGTPAWTLRELATDSYPIRHVAADVTGDGLSEVVLLATVYEGPAYENYRVLRAYGPSGRLWTATLPDAGGIP